MLAKDNPRKAGLSAQEVLESRRCHGENRITPPSEESAWSLFLEKFQDPIIRILLFIALLSLGISLIDGHFTETIGIIVAIILATGIGFLFEWDAKRRFRRLNQVNDQVPVKVLREGSVTEIPRQEVVVGDFVYIEGGEMVPADGELVEALSLRVDESTLTGEIEAMKSCDEALFDKKATYPTNYVLRGTTVREGYGAFIVERVGDHTEAGRVSEQASIESGEETPLNRQLNRLSQLIGRVGFTLAGVIFVVLLCKLFLFEGAMQLDWVALSREILDIFMISVAVIVMAVPEGLPMAITLSLALSMRRMLKTNNLVRRMHACETMGAVTVICTDKTGTLTLNRMTLSEVHPFSEFSGEELARAMALNSTAFLDRDGKSIGNPTEGALLGWMSVQGFDYATLREEARIVDRLPFSTQYKYMATLVEFADGTRRLLVKGAPEIVRTLCHEEPTLAQLEEILSDCQHRAMRTLAIAWGDCPASSCEEALEAHCLRFKAALAINDPVREEVPEAVERCLKAGIAIKIVTGDTAATAIEIARRIHLWEEGEEETRACMSGVEFAALSDEALLERIGDLKILARARPLDKQRLVRLLQQQGEVVAVTGDGTNDAPALNFAHVGLSMGSGTSVAKEASDITLLDDSFRSIATAVMWGRSLYRNIQRFVLFQLTINIVAIAVVFFGSLFGAEMPLTVVQMLWVNLIMDTFAAMAMASLPPREEVMQEPPRARDAFIISPSMGRQLLLSSLLFSGILLGLWGYWIVTGSTIALRELTLFFTLFVLLQFWNMLNVRVFGCDYSLFGHWSGCRTFLAVWAVIALGQIAIVEWGGEVFRTLPLSLEEWLWLFGLSSLTALLHELYRLLRH